MISKGNSIAVTGALGRAGKAICSALEADGYQIIRIDRTASSNPFFEPSRQVDLTRYGDVVANLHGCSAIVHFGANPWPDLDFFDGAARYANNTVGTFNVFQAAAQLGIDRIVWSSSETVQGFPYETCAPAKLPISENDPPQPQCAYALSKLSCEQLAEQMAELYGITILGLRLAHINHREFDDYSNFPSYRAAPESRRNTIWKYVDIDDVVSAVFSGLSAPVSGAHVFNIAAADTVLDIPTREIFSEHFPEVEICPELPEFGTPVDLSKAKELLDWEPAISWRDIEAAR